MSDYMYVCIGTICMQCPQKPKRASDTPGTGISSSRELPCGCWGHFDLHMYPMAHVPTHTHKIKKHK